MKLMTMRTLPIKSFPIVGKGVGEGSLYVEAADLKSAQSYRIERRSLKIYGDAQSGHDIPPEWSEDGITIQGVLNTTHGPYRDVSGIDYTIFRGKGNEVLLRC